MLTLSSPGFSRVPGTKGGGVHTAYNFKTIHGIEVKIGGVIENHKPINLVKFNWQMSSLPHNDVITIKILNFYKKTTNKR